MMTRWLLALLFVVQPLAYAENSVDRVIVLSDEGRPLMPFITLDDDLVLKVSDSKQINLKNIPVEKISELVKGKLAPDFSVGNVKLYRDQDLIKVTVLGDLDEPGNFRLPKESSLADANLYNDLFDASRFSSSMTLIRKGARKVVSEADFASTDVQNGDILMISLERKRTVALPPGSATKPEKVAPEKSRTSKQPKEQLVAEKDKQVTAAPVKAAVSGKEANHQTEERQSVTSGQLAEKRPAETGRAALVEGFPADSVKEGSSSLDQYNVVSLLKDYPLQPGDILIINLPGETGFNTDFLINRAGEITLPEVGQLTVVGKTLSETEKLIYDKLSDVYLSLDKLGVLLKEKRLLVTVLGYVNSPGEVELSSHGNVQTAINAAGGLIDGAQLDKLQLQREDGAQEFNYKRYLDTGDPLLIPTLRSLDTIFIPSSPELGNVQGDVINNGSVDSGMDPTDDRSAVKVFGEVLKPSSFPFKESMNIVDALLRAGGVTRYANVEQIRLIDGDKPIMFNLKEYLDRGDESALLRLNEGATIFVPRLVEVVKAGASVVYVMGQVRSPGAFRTGKNVGFLDVLANAGGPNRYADTTMLRLLRNNGDVIPFNLQDYTEGMVAELPKIMPGDAIFVPEKGVEVDRTWLKLPTSQSIQLLGAILKPGRYEYSPKVTFMDLIAHAGGPNKDADLANVRIVESGKDGQAVSRVFNLQSFLDRGGNWDSLPKLSGGLTIIVPELPKSPADNKANWIKLSSEQSIYIIGALQAPGRYAFNHQFDLLDILSAAEGPTEDADLSDVRVIHRNGTSPRVSKLDLVNYFETGDESLLATVEPGDTIFVPSRNRIWTQKDKEKMVRVLGAVKNSGRYEFSSEMSILDILAEAGGPTKTAFIEKIIVVNASCCKNQAYTFDLMDFMKDPDASHLPVLRPGDTIYIPDVANTQFAYFMDAIKDTLSIVSLISLTKSLIAGSAF
ncbi:MAG: SLBB domain-containing protein [Endozoicomonas sp.]